ncbi:hypothetical protein C8F04DRAFT_960701, partial [Mycena alexandri]
FAYLESSFFLVRLLQGFSSFTLAPDAQPADTKPPASWKSFPLKAKEKIHRWNQFDGVCEGQ